MDFPAIVFLNKPDGITSHAAIKKIQKIINCRKIGHCGTLDKFARGLLILLLNKATRLSQFFLRLPKTYLAEITFGVQTDTLDPEGSRVAQGPVPDFDTVSRVLSEHFMGKILQVPPLYSAVHVQGERASKLARKGENPVLPAREVEIFDYKVQNYRAPRLIVRMHVSSGTYVRSIARDLGKQCGTVAYLSKLNRLSIAGISLQEAFDFEAIRQVSNDSKEVIYSDPAAVLERLYRVKKCYVENAEQRTAVKHGQLPASYCKMKGDFHRFLALYNVEKLLGIWEMYPKLRSVFHI